MKKLIILILLVLMSSACFANPKVWFDSHADKISHALAGGVTAGLSFKHGADPVSIVLNTTIVGGLKEAFDYKFANRWDNWDWLATILGGVIFLVL
ncbi:MAG: hypothetical protein HQ564_08510 [Candidatus Saganbacteria bacterium]|nr:hypothetical protein [Candidatus Saganbacteria bacterium]